MPLFIILYNYDINIYLCQLFSPFPPLRLGEVLTLFHFFLCKIVAIKKQKSSITLLVYTQSRASFPSWFGLSITSHFWLKIVYKVSEHSHIWIIRLRVSVADWWSYLLQKVLLLRAFTRNQQYVFLPLLVSFSECIHVYRFQFRCSHTVLYIHYNKASQHWGIATLNYDLFYRTSWVD